MKSAYLPGLFVVLCFVSTFRCLAAEGQALTSPAYKAREILVTATRCELPLRDTPDIVQVIDRERIEALHPKTTGELLEYANGAAISTGTGSGLPDRSVVSLNGLPANYTLVLVDGVRLVTDHIHTGQNIELIPPQSIERIEIMRGAASAQYGTDAIGGIVNIVTRKRRDQGGASVRASAGSYNTYEGGVDFILPTSNGVCISSFANWEGSEGIPLKAPASRIDNTGFERLNLLNRIDVKLDESTELFSWINWVSESMDWRGGESDSYLVTPVVGFEHQVTQDAGLGGQVSYSMWDAEMNDEKNTFLEPEMHSRYRIRDDQSLLMGIDGKWNEFERTAVENHEQFAHGVYLQHEWVPGDMFSMMSALRYDKVENIDHACSPKLSMLFAPYESIRLRVSAGRGFHAPTLQELYEEGYGHSGSAYRFGNPDLKPEYSTTYTAGLELQPAEIVQFMLYGFYSDLDDMIVPVYMGPWEKDPGVDVWRRTNIKNARVFGGDALVRLTVGDFAQIESGYTYSDNEDSDTGRQLPYSPGSSLHGKLTIRQHFRGNVQLREFVGVRAGFDREAWNWKPAAGTQPDNPDGLTTRLKDYTRLDAGMTLSVGDEYELFVKVENILGEDIENLDDVFTVIDGEPLVTVGVCYNLPFSHLK